MEMCPVLPQSHPIHRALTGEGKEDEGPTETAKGWLGIHSLSSSSKPHSVQSGKRVQRDPPIQAAPGSLCFLVLRHVQQVTPFPLATSGRDRMMESPRRLGRGWGGGGAPTLPSRIRRIKESDSPTPGQGRPSTPTRYRLKDWEKTQPNPTPAARTTAGDPAAIPEARGAAEGGATAAPERDLCESRAEQNRTRPTLTQQTRIRPSVA